MHAACLVAEYESQSAAKIGIEVLRKSDFQVDAISVAWKGHTKALGKVDRGDSGNDVGVESSMEIGAGIGALIGTPLAIGSVMGPIMIAGPLAAVFGGAALGAVVSEAGVNRENADRVDSRGLYAMANHYGINSHSASKYEKRIDEGSILVIVTSTPPRLDEAQRSLKTTGPASLQRFDFQHSDDKAP